MVVNPLSREIEITKDGQPLKLFMSYGLLSRLTTQVGGPDGWNLVSTDAELQGQVLLTIFEVRDRKTGEVTSKINNVDQLDVDLDDIEKVLEWAGAHIVDFFTRRIEKNNKQYLEAQERLQKSTLSKNGFLASPSSTPV